jgi:predicted glutamine amidotransferase
VPQGVALPPKDKLKNCAENNPDGMGFAYVKDGEIYLSKGIFEFESFYNRLVETRKYNDSNMLIHFRIATHGTVKTENCHPFIINEDMVMIHNGMLSNVECYKDTTDSESFAIDYLSKMTPEMVKHPGVYALLDNFIGIGSKIAILTSADEVIMFNKKGWHERDGVFFSNYTYNYAKFSYVGDWKTYKKTGKDEYKHFDSQYYDQYDSYYPESKNEGSLVPFLEQDRKGGQKGNGNAIKNTDDGLERYYRTDGTFDYEKYNEEVEEAYAQS